MAAPDCSLMSAYISPVSLVSAAGSPASGARAGTAEGRELV